MSVGADSVRRSVDWIEVHGREGRRKLVRLLGVGGDAAIGQIIHEVRAPIPLQARWIDRIEEALNHRVRHGPDQIEQRFADRAHRRSEPLCVFRRRGAAPHDRAHPSMMELGREHRCGRHGHEREKAAHFLRRLAQELTKRMHDLGGLLGRPECRTRKHVSNGVRLEQERRDHAEVSTAAAYRPEEIVVLVSAGSDETAIGEHDVGGEQVVDGKAVGRVRCPMPPPSVRPPTPVVEMMPLGTASPNGWVA